MADEPTITIDGVTYQMPGQDSFTMAEQRWIKRYTGLTGRQLQQIDPTDPDLIAAVIHILFARQNAENGRRESFEEIEERVGAVKLASIEASPDEEETEVPPTSRNAANSTGSEKPLSSGPNGNGDSATLLETFHAPTGSPV